MVMPVAWRRGVQALAARHGPNHDRDGPVVRWPCPGCDRRAIWGPGQADGTGGAVLRPCASCCCRPLPPALDRMSGQSMFTDLPWVTVDGDRSPVPTWT
jgi:hypothetical protein